MSQYFSILLHDVVVLITILNPIAAVSIMISMIDNPTKETIKPIAFKATITVFVASLITLFTGELIFRFIENTYH